MHWFWRAAIAGVLATGLGIGLVWLTNSGLPANTLRAVVQFVYGKCGNYLGAGLLFFLPVALVGIGAYGILTTKYGPVVRDPETRCRKCGYILRGITEPRCPECGERI